ncbi:MAG: hypothetical protein P8X73_01100 [Ignavibacteriaceae bacterium]
MKKYLILILGLFSSITNGQQTFNNYNSEKEQLTANKIQLQNEIAELKIEIDSLNNLVPQLEQNIFTSYRELFVIKYGEEIGNKIAYKQIWIGMTDEMVLDSWGKPDYVDKNKEAWGTFTQWYYGDVIFFFKNGELTDWEGEEEKNSK